MTAQLYHGDCLEIMPTLPAGSVDAIITDLPYGTTACEWDSIIPLAPMWAAVKHVLKPCGAFITTAGQPFTSVLVCSNLEWFKYCNYYEKERGTGFARSAYEPLSIVEDIPIFCDSVITFNPQKSKLKKPYTHILPTKKSESDPIASSGCDGNGKRITKLYEYSSPVNLLRFARDLDGFHPTQKPVALYEYLIRTYTNPGQTVLDCCMGSGTTGVAAIQTGRDFIRNEKERKYFEIAEKRIAQAQPPLFVETARAIEPKPEQTGFGI
jgi:site-specific DNA-methyltransferase (adenine-specific)